jgi:hypothetical protein
MRNLLAFVAAALLAFAGLGWYFDWYKVQTVSTTQGHQGFTIDINRDKISQDIGKGAGKVQEVLEKKTQGEAKVPAAQPQGAADNGILQTGGVQPRVVISAEEPYIPGQQPQPENAP